ncbi:MAG: hypothetical protein WBE18_07090 [Gammaproteobacteria bacterium]
MRLKRMLQSGLLLYFSLWAVVSIADLPVFDFASWYELANSVNELMTQSEYLKKQLDALKQLENGQFQWSNAQGLIEQLGQITNQSNGLSYNAANVNMQFQALFPGYKVPQDFNQQYQKIVEATLQTMNNTLQAIGSNAYDFQSENSRLQFLQAQAQSAVGQTQAIQAASQIASEQVSQLQLLRQTIAAQTNAQAAYYAAQMQKETTAKAVQDQLIDNGKKGPLPPLVSN